VSGLVPLTVSRYDTAWHSLSFAVSEKSRVAMPAFPAVLAMTASTTTARGCVSVRAEQTSPLPLTAPRVRNTSGGAPELSSFSWGSCPPTTPEQTPDAARTVRETAAGRLAELLIDARDYPKTNARCAFWAEQRIGVPSDNVAYR
jgi:hypothetical protein